MPTAITGLHPKVTKDAVYISVGNHVTALNIDGTLKWTTVLWPAGFFNHQGNALSPHGSVFYVTYGNPVESGELKAYQTCDGAFLWSYTVDPFLCGIPVVNNKNGDIYVAQILNQLLAITKYGALRWITLAATSPQWWPPAVSPDGQRLYVGRAHPISGDILLACINALDGSDIWVTPDPGFDLVDNMQNQSPVVSSDGSTVYVWGNFALRAYNSNGTLKWWYNAIADGFPITGVSLLLGGDIIMTEGIVIYRHSQFDGHRIWAWGDGHFDNNNISIDSNGVIYTSHAAAGGHIRAIDQNGALVWTLPGIAANGEIAIGDGRIYFLDAAWNLNCVR